MNLIIPVKFRKKSVNCNNPIPDPSPVPDLSEGSQGKGIRGINGG